MTIKQLDTLKVHLSCLTTSTNMLLILYGIECHCTDCCTYSQVGVINSFLTVCLDSNTLFNVILFIPMSHFIKCYNVLKEA